jgi:hypothetical protein
MHRSRAALDSGPDGPQPRGDASVRAGGAVVALVAAAALALGIDHGLGVTARLLSPSSVRQASLGQTRDRCIYREVRRELPKGASFYASMTSLLYAQRLAELATLWAVPRPAPRSAGWLVTVVPGRCAGIRVKAWRA